MSSDRWDLQELEKHHSRTGALPEEGGLNFDLYRADVASDARKAEALALRSDGDHLLRIRALLLRGKTAAAEKLIGTATGVDPVELLTEEARLCSSHGDWTGCRDLASLALARGPQAQGHLTLSQIRASAHFELGEMMKAIEDLETVESLSSLFPRCLSGHYARILRSKIVARDQGAQAGLSHLAKTWRDLGSSGALDADLALALLRTEIDVRRLAGLPHSNLATASWLIAESIGDLLYSALARLDAHIACGRGDAGLAAQLAEDRKKFARVDRLLCELEGTASASATAASMLTFRASPSPLADIHAYRAIFLPNRDAIIHLAPEWRLESLEANPRVKEALLALSQGPLSKEAFFERVWRESGYSPLRHDNRIYSLLNRCKKSCGIVASIVDGMVSTPGVLACET